MVETYVGYLKTFQDALIVLEACCRGELPLVQHRLSSKERIHIRSGSVFVWNEREAGMRRWTDGRSWSPSRILGGFLTYRELDSKRWSRRTKPHLFHYKPNGLVKQSFSITTDAHQRMHIISYYTKADVLSGKLMVPSMDERLRHIVSSQTRFPKLTSRSFHTANATPSPPLSLTLSLSASSVCSDDEFHPPMSLQRPACILPIPLPFLQIVPREDQRQLNALSSQLRL